MSKNVDIIGQKFGNLLVLDQSRNKNNTLVKCLCDCGNVIISNKSAVKNKLRTNCGCIPYKSFHNLSNTPTYNSWRGMKKRCYQKNHCSYKNYGARGITVCDEWMGENGFKNFVRDMGLRPEGKTLDRIRCNGNYSGDNCRWATTREQAENKRNNKKVTYKGVIKTVSAWERSLGYKRNELNVRLRRYSFEKSISTPSHFTRLERMISYDKWKTRKKT